MAKAVSKKNGGSQKDTRKPRAASAGKPRAPRGGAGTRGRAATEEPPGINLGEQVDRLREFMLRDDLPRRPEKD